MEDKNKGVKKDPIDSYIKGRISVDEYVRKVINSNEGDNQRRTISREFNNKCEKFKVQF